MANGLKDRIKQLATYYGCSIRKFEEKCRLGRGNVNNMSEVLGSDKLAKIIDTYPEVSCEWLLTGRGEMLKQKSEDHSDASAITHVDELTRIIHTQAATLLKQQRFINEHFGREGLQRISLPHIFSEFPDKEEDMKK